MIGFDLYERNICGISSTLPVIMNTVAGVAIMWHIPQQCGIGHELPA